MTSPSQPPVSPQARHNRIVTLVIGLIVIVIAGFVTVEVVSHRASSTNPPVAATTPAAPTTPSVTPTPTPTQTPTPTPTAFDKKRFSLTDPNSLWVIVNKQNPLDPKNYAPPLAALNLPGRGGEMRPQAATALRKMFAAYQKSSGSSLSVVSPYRSYSTQVSTYAGWVSRLGKAQADRQSARPGYSEHQTGLAVDIDTAVDQGFGKTPPGKWLAKNSYKFGFIVRYPEGQEKVTGYEYEPWHFRYVGSSLATELHDTHAKSLEAFFGYPAAPTY